LDGARPGDSRPPATVRLTAMNFGAYPMPNGLARLASRHFSDAGRIEKLRARVGEDLDAKAAAEAGLVTFTPDEIDWDDEVRIALEERAAFSPDALTGLEASLRFGGPETLKSKIFGRLSAWQNWIFQRPNAVGPKGALVVYGTGERDEMAPRRAMPFGDHKGRPLWQDVPGEYRGVLRRLIVTQRDTEPASVEQQRHLGRTCPSLYDLRNLFQVNVEEGRHLWAMVYLLDAYFGRDGREESEALLERRSGDPDKPRILGAFNEKTLDWLSYLMFTYFTDRDGKYQLASLAESGFDPLARTCRFMLTEEAHHMFVGETGVGRVVQRTCELMRDGRTDDVRKHGAIDLPTLQKYLNFHYSVS